MAYKTPDRITVLEGLEAVRRWPALYIGGEDGAAGARG
jgi:DNA gyrase/topoisomerase IV subunit B